jgi:alpha-ribazole phosphatase
VNPNRVTTVDLLRHGAPEGGTRYRGSLDDPLSEQGWREMRAAVGEYHPWQVIVSSPLHRCAAFAKDLSERLDVPLEIEPGWREIGFGVWEGRTPEEINAATPEALALFWHDPINHPPAGGELLEDFASRVVAAWRGLLKRHCGCHALVVSHGGVIRMVLCHVLEMPLRRLWRLEVPYASCSRVRVYAGIDGCEPSLVFHGKALE